MSEGGPAWVGKISSAVVINVATLGPIGRCLPAPGTWGSLAGIAGLAVVAIGPGLATWALVVAGVIGFYLGAVVCGEAEVRLRERDPGKVILDEFVSMPLCFLGWEKFVSGPLPWWGVLLAGFVLFRFFDILKPLGISKLQNLPGGWGVQSDDTAAALASCATLHAGFWIWAQWLG